MRIKRTVSKSDTARRELASEPTATALKVLAPPARSFAPKRDAAFDPSAEPLPASLEAMFLEISSADPNDGGNQDLAALAVEWELELFQILTTGEAGLGSRRDG